MKRTLHDTVELSGHVIVRCCTHRTHAVEFTPVDRSFVRVRSWNAPASIRYPASNWVLVSSYKLKIQLSRDLWRAMRKRGYWVWLGGRSKELPEGSCAS